MELSARDKQKLERWTHASKGSAKTTSQSSNTPCPACSKALQIGECVELGQARVRDVVAVADVEIDEMMERSDRDESFVADQLAIPQTQRTQMRQA